MSLPAAGPARSGTCWQLLPSLAGQQPTFFHHTYVSPGWGTRQRVHAAMQSLGPAADLEKALPDLPRRHSHFHCLLYENGPQIKTFKTVLRSLMSTLAPHFPWTVPVTPTRNHLYWLLAGPATVSSHNK